MKAGRKEVNKVDSVSTVSTVNSVNSVNALINRETTLNEIMQHCNRRTEKTRKRPSVDRLQRNFKCVARFVDADLNYKITVFENGYAAYQEFDRETVINLRENLSPTGFSNRSNHSDRSGNVQQRQYDSLGEMSWPLAILLLGGDQITQNMFGHLREASTSDAHRFGDNTQSEGNNDVNDSDVEDNDAVRKPVLNVHIDDPETAYIRKETRREKRSAMFRARMALTPKQNEVFKLRFEQKMTLEEVGSEMNISPYTVADHIEGIAKKYHKYVDPVR